MENLNQFDLVALDASELTETQGGLIEVGLMAGIAVFGLAVIGGIALGNWLFGDEENKTAKPPVNLPSPDAGGQ